MSEKTNEKLRVGILGTGKMADVMVDSIAKMKHVEVAAVASRQMETACRFASRHNLEKAYGKYEELIKDDDVDLVYIASPHSHHAFYASECIDRKKPVLVEKSFTANAEQAEALVAKAEHEGVFLAEAIWTRYMPMTQTIRDTAWSGKIGKINSISANLGYPVSKNYRVIAPELAGGALLDVGVYPLNLIASVVGTDVTDISAQARLSKKGVDLENNVFLSIKDKDGEAVKCSFYSSVIGPTDRKAIIYGTEGYIEIGNCNNFEYLEIFNNDHKLVERIKRPRQTETGYVYQFESCRKALKEGRLEPEEMPHSETVKIMKIMDLIRQGMGVRYPFEK